MDCHDARLLLTLQRRDPEQLDAVELDAVERHIDLCPGCQNWNQSEARFESAVVSALKDIKPAADLKSRINARLTATRPRSRTVWVAAAAAILLAIGGTGGYFALRPETIDLDYVVHMDDEESSRPQGVRSYFADLGYPMTPPPDFQYDYLVSYKLARFQGRIVPRLTFQSRQANGSIVMANVYCLSPRQFRYDDAHPHFLTTDHRHISVVRSERDLYVVDCTGGDVWLLRRGTY
jgi:hypothetical protein